MNVKRDPILKRCRNLGISPGVLGYSKETVRDPYRNARRRKPSEYALQLREKQKAKFIYGVQEKQFLLTYGRAQKLEGQPGENLLILLESRLDNIAFIMGWGTTRRQARQLVSHGHLLLNGRRVDIPSIRVKEGDVVSIRPRSRQTELFKGFAENPRVIPEWISGTTAFFEATINRPPTREEIDVPVDELLIVELYSK